MKRHLITGAVVGGVATVVSVLLFSPVNGEEIVDEIEVEVESKEKLTHAEKRQLKKLEKQANKEA